jgi:hypothetical protein
MLLVHTVALFLPVLANVLGPDKRASVILFLRLCGAEGTVMAPLMSRV